jgi:HlyD family secretion protein
MKTRHLLLAALALAAFAGPRLSAASLSASGRIVPASGVIDVFGPSGDRVEQVMVAEGAEVAVGDPLARLSSAAIAERRVANAAARLATLRANNTADLEVAKLKLTAADNEAKFFSERVGRITQVKDSEFVSPDTVEERRISSQKADAEVAAARAHLKQVTSEGANAIAAAEIDLDEVRRTLDHSVLHAPLKARVLKCRARPGQLVDSTELFKLGDVSAINVIAEVYESDALKVKTGQHAAISSSALPGKVTGVVQNVGSMVYRDSLDSLDPSRQMNAHIVEVTIRLDQAAPLDRLIFLQVEVTIDL